MHNYNDVKSLWADTLKLLESEFTEVVFNTWIKKLIPMSLENNCLILKTEQNFFKNTIEQRYLDKIINILQSVCNSDIIAKIVTEADLSNKPNKKIKSSSNNNLNPKYIFETFVRGKSNELAYAAALAIAEAPGKTTYNPLFLYGGVGLGKTHLMHSIGNYILNQNPNTKVLYASTETFTNELINSIRERKNQEFRNKYRDIDVLLIDDIQFLSDKEGTQEEFFHTFNTLYEANKQIVISSDQPPKEIKTLEERLRSRFGCGLIVDITLPDFETRTAIVEKKAELDHIKIPTEVTKFIAKNIVSNIRELEGALNKVAAYSKLTNMQITIELAEQALRDLIIDSPKPDITVEFIQEIVANYYNITVEDMRGKKRTQTIAYPRQIAMYLSRKLIDMSLPKIGERFGGRDHSTIIHGCDKIFTEIENNPKLQKTIDELEKKIKGE
jgi:chromosomal replication initiator protein DnaA